VRTPDILSFARIGLTAPVALAILVGADALGVGLLGVALATDFLDGWFARRCGSTAMGRVLDPLADKILVAGTLAALLAAGRVPAELVGVVILRDVALLSFGWIRWRSAMPIPSASPLGKASFAALGVWLVGAVAGLVWPPWTAGVVAVAYSLAGFGYAGAVSAPVRGTAEGKR
jgi:phosphatidylglycerophosphate synthase